MADTSYLFGGATPASVTGTLTDSGLSLPAWLQEYTRGLASQATAVAGEQYQPYTSPTNAATYGEDAGRIAGFTPAQRQAQQQILASQGNYQPNLTQASNIQGQALANAQSAQGGYQPYFNQGAASQNQAMASSQANKAGYQPYLSAAGQSSVQNIGSYMSPYTDSVVNRIAQLGQRNLSENLLPQVNSTFTGAGQFGSTRNADFTNRALRDTSESVLGQQSSALQSGYQSALTASQDDLARQAQLAQMAGNLGNQDAATMSAIGQAQTGAGQAYGNLSNQTTNALNTLGQSQSALGQLTQQLGLQQAGALETMGQTQQAQQQQNMNLANTDFTNQLNYPKTQLSFLSDIIRGTPTSQTSYSSVANPTASTGSTLSPLAAAAQGFLGAKTLTATK